MLLHIQIVTIYCLTLRSAMRTDGRSGLGGDAPCWKGSAYCPDELTPVLKTHTKKQVNAQELVRMVLHVHMTTEFKCTSAFHETHAKTTFSTGFGKEYRRKKCLYAYVEIGVETVEAFCTSALFSFVFETELTRIARLNEIGTNRKLHVCCKFIKKCYW